MDEKILVIGSSNRRDNDLEELRKEVSSLSELDELLAEEVNTAAYSARMMIENFDDKKELKTKSFIGSNSSKKKYKRNTAYKFHK